LIGEGIGPRDFASGQDAAGSAPSGQSSVPTVRADRAGDQVYKIAENAAKKRRHP